MSVPERYTCEEMFRRIDRYVDRTLSEDELRRVEAHLEECATCAGEYRFERSLLDGVRAKLRRIDLPSDLMSRISARLETVAEDPCAPEDEEPGSV